jgi:hypothetical protein
MFEEVIPMRTINETLNEPYIDLVYDLVKQKTEGMDSVYAEYIEELVGFYGLHALHHCKLLETCGVVNGRQLYTLCEKKS